MVMYRSFAARIFIIELDHVAMRIESDFGFDSLAVFMICKERNAYPRWVSP